jgi:toxin ParE1/3/4
MALFFTPKAESDLISIWEYIAEDSVSEADGYINKIQAVCSLLESKPGMGVIRNALPEGVRLMPFEKYNIYYAAESTGVTIIRIRHSAQDPASLRFSE